MSRLIQKAEWEHIEGNNSDTTNRGNGHGHQGQGHDMQVGTWVTKVVDGVIMLWRGSLPLKRELVDDKLISCLNYLRPSHQSNIPYYFKVRKPTVAIQIIQAQHQTLPIRLNTNNTYIK